MNPYLECLRYRGTDGAVVELRFNIPRGRRGRSSWHRWWWRIVGEEQWYGGTGLRKIECLIQAAHHRGMSCAMWDPMPEDPTFQIVAADLT